MKSILLALLTVVSMQAGAQVTANAGSNRDICLFDTLKVNGSGLNTGDTGSYQWRDLSNGLVVSNQQLLSVKITINANRSYQLRVQKTSNMQTYTAFDTFVLTVNPLPTFTFKGLPPMCYRQCSVELSKNYIAVGNAGYNAAVKDSALRYYQRKSGSWITGGPAGINPYVYNFCGFISNNQVPKTGLRDTICYEYTDPKGCYAKECKPVRMNPDPEVELKQWVFCQQAGPVELNKMVAKPFNRVGGIESFRCIAVPAGSGVDSSTIITMNSSVTPPAYELSVGSPSQRNLSGDYTIEYCFKDPITGCQSCDTSLVRVIRLPLPVFSALPPVCINSALLPLDSFVRDSFSRKRFPDGSWKTIRYNGSADLNNPNVAPKILNSVVSQKLFDARLGSGQYLLKFEDSASGCTVSDSTLLLVNGLPIVQISVPDTVCSASAPFALNNISPSGNVGTWSGPGVQGRNFNPGAGTQSSRFHNYWLRYAYTHPLTKCTSSDSQRIVVQSLPVFQAYAAPLGGTSYYVQFGISGIQFTDTSKASCLWFFGNGDSSRYFNPGQVYFKDSGAYAAILQTNDGSCMRTDTMRFTLGYRTTGLNAPEAVFSVYPNPADETLHILIDREASVHLFDLNGRTLTEQLLSAGLRNTIDVSGFQAGIYLLKIQSGNQIVWKRLMIR